jgi:hypothetical protein
VAVLDTTERGQVHRPEESATWTRFRLLGQLVVELYRLRRSSVLVQRVDGQPVLYVRTGPGLRMLAVLAVQGERGAWGYLWDGDSWAAADGTAQAARRTAGVVR